MENRIYCEDNLETLRRMEDAGLQPDLVVTSPPYDDLRAYNGFSFNADNLAHGLFRAMKQGGGCCLDSRGCRKERIRNGNIIQAGTFVYE